ncbi:MAG TPA: XRE family transcriptional regulator [Micromonosporaceae bacterium]|nr:XRE family transcriptional regulator [Micromonosporaceae bacterium]
MTTVETWAEVGDRIREARLAAGLSQGQLALAVGLERTALVRVEAGQRQLTALELFRVADALRLPLAHFVTRPPEAMRSRRQALADEADSAARDRLQLDAALEMQLRDTEQLVADGVLVPPVPPTVRQVSTPDDAAALARDARRILGHESGPLGSVAEVAERFGLFLTVVDLDADGASMFLDTYGVAVTGCGDPGRRRWTAVHELGHHLIRDEYHTDVGVATSRDERERLVDTFAGEFLLPQNDLLAKAEKMGEDTRTFLIGVAAAYRLSWSAVVDRARCAGLVSAEEAQRLRARTPMKGDFLAVCGREPYPDLPVGDRGPLWTQAVLRAHREGLITGQRAVELLGGRITLEELPEEDCW